MLHLVAKPAKAEADVRRVASALRSVFRNRVARELRNVAVADLPKLREDPRWGSIISPAVSGIASPDVEGYLAASKLDALARDFLMVPADGDANVVIHVLAEGRKSYPESKLLLAADLADQRDPRAELRAAQLLGEVANARSVAKR